MQKPRGDCANCREHLVQLVQYIDRLITTVRNDELGEGSVSDAVASLLEGMECRLSPESFFDMVRDADGAEPLVYLALSATQGVDVVEYPDSRKVAASVGPYPARKRWVFREKDQADYFEGEE